MERSTIDAIGCFAIPMCQYERVLLRDAAVLLILGSCTGCGLNLLGQGGSPDGGGPRDGTVTPSDAPTSQDTSTVEPDASSDSDTPLDSGLDAAPGDAPDDSSPFDVVVPVPGNYVLCGSQLCMPPSEGCCLSTMTCTDAASCGGTFMACDDRTECTGGSICCVSVHSNGQIRFIACIPTTECQSPPGGNNTGYELCNRDSGEPCALGTMGCGMNATGVPILDPYGTCN